MKYIIITACIVAFAGITGCAQFENIRATYCAAVSDAEREQLRASFKERTGQTLKIDCSQ